MYMYMFVYMLVYMYVHMYMYMDMYLYGASTQARIVTRRSVRQKEVHQSDQERDGCLLAKPIRRRPVLPPPRRPTVRHASRVAGPEPVMICPGF